MGIFDQLYSVFGKIIIDDIVTSGTTISHLLKSLRLVNDSNDIVIFSLIGKNINE